MWFKNLVIFPIKTDQLVDDTTLEQALAEHEFQPCSQQQQVSLGFCPPLPGGDAFCFNQGHNTLMAIKRQERLLPSSVISEALAEKVEQIEQKESRKVGRNERQTLKDEITFELLPRAFTRTQQHWLYINRDAGYVIIGVGSASRADELLSLLREALGTLPAVPLASKLNIANLLTETFVGEHGELLAAGDEFELRQTGETDTITRHKNHELSLDECKQLLADDWQVSKLLCNWRDRIQFILDKDGLIKRIKFSETLFDDNDDYQDDDTMAAATDFTLQAEQINYLLQDLSDLVA
ncbi:recombination-associated protein RdgC [Salinibius halmophilus]|uniref:recombination-associated protein RdgC n=1 Tax=Salinibius halmophilus TaxID=1853216 RepID=UPI000E6708F2|nr:recombination-associated protein RdgC [Salinibius halmophilus]